VRRRFALTFRATSDANWSTLRTLAVLPGPLWYVDPLEPNLLTINQSTGTDELATTAGFAARVQGAVSSSTTQDRSGVRSLQWDSSTALNSTGRGVDFATSLTAVDSTWTAVRVGVAYSFSVYARASAALTARAGIAWYSTTPALLSTDTGSGTALGTADWNTRLLCENKTAPANAAYAVPLVENTSTPAATRTMYLDDPQLEQGTAASTWRVGAGTPLVAVDALNHQVVIARPSGVALHDVDLELVEL
jgi:hypothetical protein